jgi:hypothetical protein
MFDSLADKMKQDLDKEVNTTERMIRMVAVVVISVVLFGGLYFVFRTLG